MYYHIYYKMRTYVFILLLINVHVTNNLRQGRRLVLTLQIYFQCYYEMFKDI